MNWNRYYRPTRVADLHLLSVRDELLNMLATGFIPQALLFAGPKGTGKTTAARVLAAVLNDPRNLNVVTKQYREKKEQVASLSLVDVTKVTAEQKNILTGSSFLVRELDAASNRGIDDIRQLKEAAFTPPPIGVMSVYILDEAHMLTTEAWNALLKLLEEPPSHVVFILATTELQKIPATIRSRCREVFFSQASHEEISAALSNVAKHEKLTLAPLAITHIAEAAGGSFRDGIKLLEQVAVLNTSDLSDITAVLHRQITAEYTKLLQLVLAKEPQNILLFFDRLRANNSDEQAFIKGFLSFLHTQLVAIYTKNAPTLTSETVLRYLLTQLQTLPSGTHSPLPHLPLELELLNMIAKSTTKQEPAAPASPAIKKPAITMSKVPKPQNHTGSAKQVCERWEEILVSCSHRNFGLATLLRSARTIILAESSLEIQVYYDFHREQLLQPKFYTALCEIIEQVSGGSLLLSVATATIPSEAELVEVGQTSLRQLAVAALM